MERIVTQLMQIIFLLFLHTVNQVDLYDNTKDNSLDYEAPLGITK